MLDRSNESTRWQIAHTFAQWATRAAVQSQGRQKNFKKDQAAVNSYTDAVDFNRPFDRSLGSIGADEFSDWRGGQVRRLMSCHENINVGWAAKMIAIYLKVTCYLSGFGREGLDSVIHPPFDSNLMERIAERNPCPPRRPTWASVSENSRRPVSRSAGRRDSGCRFWL